MFSAASVCLSFCLFVNMITSETGRLGALYKNLTRVRIWGQRSKVKVTGTKKEKVRHFVRKRSSRARVVSFNTGGKISACCLVSNNRTNIVGKLSKFVKIYNYLGLRIPLSGSSLRAYGL